MIRLLLDMDGPLADFDAHGWRACIDEGIEVDVAGQHEQTARFFTDHIPDRRSRDSIRMLIDDTPWFRYLPVTPGAVDGVRDLIGAGVDVWVVTKPLEVNRTCRDDKAAWLRDHFPMLERRLIIAPDKSLVQGDLLLDDAPHPAWFGSASWRPVIFSCAFNGAGSEWAGLPRWSWGDPVEALLEVASP